MTDERYPPFPIPVQDFCIALTDCNDCEDLFDAVKDTLG